MEKFPTPEFNETETALIERLKALDPKSPEVRKEFQEWSAEQEALAQSPEKNTSKEDTYRADFEKDMHQVKLLRAAGWLQEAWDAADAIQSRAREQGDRDAFDEAGRMLDEIERQES